MVYDCFRDHICQFCHSTYRPRKLEMDTGFADTTLLFSQTWYGHPYKQEGIKKMKKLLRGREEQKQQAHLSR